MNAKPSSSGSKPTLRRLISETEEKHKSDQKKARETPPPSEWKKEFGDKCKLSPDGRSFELTVREDADIKKAYEMQSGARREEIERGDLMQSRLKRERMTRKDTGRVMEVPEEISEQVRHKFRPVGRNGQTPSERFSMMSATRDYERGPDGLYFKWNGGWEPTNLWRNGALSPQRDPDGNLWVEVDGDWLLTDEVA